MEEDARHAESEERIRTSFDRQGLMSTQGATVVSIALGRLGYPVSELWDVHPLDWLPPDEGGPTAEEVAARVLRDVQGGSIVLRHLGG